MTDASKHSRRCVYCGNKVRIDKVKRVGTAESARDAALLVQQLKMKKAR